MKRMICVLLAIVILLSMAVTACSEGADEGKMSDTMLETLSGLVSQYEGMTGSPFKDDYTELLYKVYKAYVSFYSLEQSENLIKISTNGILDVSETMSGMRKDINLLMRSMEIDIDTAWDKYLSGKISMDDFDKILMPIIRKHIEAKRK